MNKPATIRSKFVTATETARILGVPSSRAHELIEMVNGEEGNVFPRTSMKFKVSTKKRARAKISKTSR